MPNRLIVIADIHGHYKALRSLFSLIKPVKDDEFVFLGDYIDRGPDSSGVVQEIINLSQKCLVHPVMGNHEEMLLAAIHDSSEMAFWLKFGGRECLASYNVSSPKDIPGDHLRFYGSLLDFYENENSIFVHAQYLPASPLKETGNGILRWSSGPKYPRPHFSGKCSFHGHVPHRIVVDQGTSVFLDTGCGVLSGGLLTAVDILGNYIWQVTDEGDVVRDSPWTRKGGGRR